MKTSFVTLGTKHDGKLKVFDRVGFDRAFAEYGEGEELEIELRSPEIGRTQAQNRFFHGPVLRAFMTLGYHKQDAKDMLALRFIPLDLKLMDGTIVRVPGHTSALNKKDFTDFVDACVQLAAEEGLVIEDSDKWRKENAA